jgi:hypothetical protein
MPLLASHQRATQSGGSLRNESGRARHRERPTVGKPIGGIIVFAGGRPLYHAAENSSAVSDLAVQRLHRSHHAWKVRAQPKLDTVPMGPARRTMTI